MFLHILDTGGKEARKGVRESTLGEEPKKKNPKKGKKEK